jgi:23S rRNA pseudouridine2605 synthase
MLERIQKIISAAGVTSRRAAEELITEGRVRVNGKVVTELGTKADPSKDHIKVDGKLINPQQPQTYIMLNKPAGFVTTMSDPEGRPTVQDLLKGIKVRVYPVGRLDYNTEGLLLLTNDGDFAHLITHPKHEFPKTYLAKVKGVLEDSQIDNLENGIYLDDGKTAPAKIKKVRKEEANSWLEITIHEGRKRQVRRMFDRVGHSVIRLKRIRTGNQTLGDLAEGTFRYLTPDEVSGLREMAQKTGAEGREPGVKGQGSGGRSQEPGLRSQKAAVRPQKVMNAGRDEPRLMNERGTKKPAHRGARPDARPWRTERGINEGQGSRGKGQGVIGSNRRPATGIRSQKAGVGRVRTPAMQDTREGLRRNQVVKVSAPNQKRQLEGQRASASGSPRGVSTYSPTSRPAASRSTMRTSIGRPVTRAAMGKPEVRRKPDQRPWPSTRKSGPGSKGPGSIPSYGPRRDSSARPATRPASSRPTTRAGVGRSATGAAMRRPEAGRKPAPRSWPDRGSGRSDSRGKGAWHGSREAGQRPVSGPRPNRSTHSGGKGPGRGKRPAGSRGPGQGAGKRGPRR